MKRILMLILLSVVTFYSYSQDNQPHLKIGGGIAFGDWASTSDGWEEGVIIDSDDNSPILGAASIMEVNTNNGVISDYSGRFKIIVNDTSKNR